MCVAQHSKTSTLCHSPSEGSSSIVCVVVLPQKRSTQCNVQTLRAIGSFSCVLRDLQSRKSAFRCITCMCRRSKAQPGTCVYSHTQSSSDRAHTHTHTHIQVHIQPQQHTAASSISARSWCVCVAGRWCFLFRINYLSLQSAAQQCNAVFFGWERGWGGNDDGSRTGVRSKHSLHSVGKLLEQVNAMRC